MSDSFYIPEQFSRNLGIMDTADFKKLATCKVLVVGVGGLGGNVVNGLVRLGLKHLKLVDYDLFENSNLNRQLFSNMNNIGRYKSEVVKCEMEKINPNCVIETAVTNIKDVPLEELKEFDYIIDAVDNADVKIYLSMLSEKLNIPLLHGACAGWYGQVGWMMPGNHLIQELYENNVSKAEKDLMNPSFIPSVVSSFMVAEFLKMIQHSDATTINELLLIDVLNNSLLKTGEKKNE